MTDEKNKKTGSGSFDDLLKEARAAINDIDETRGKAKTAYEESTLGQVSKQVTAIHKTFNQVAQAGLWVYDNVIDPIVSSRWAGWPFRAYGKLWNAAVYSKDDDGEPIFSKRRAGLLLCTTLVAAMNIVPITGAVVGTAWDAGWMATTTRTETWYLGKSQEIDPLNNIFATQGCETVNCTDQNSIYFRIRPSIMNHLWKYSHNGSAFYSDFIAAAIPNDTNKCEVTYYGARAKLFVRGLDIYPQILSVQCSPLTVNDLQGPQAMLDMDAGGTLSGTYSHISMPTEGLSSAPAFAASAVGTAGSEAPLAHVPWTPVPVQNGAAHTIMPS